MERHKTFGLDPLSDPRRPRLVKTASGALYWDVKPGNVRSHLTLLAVHAHPDDESSKGAATLAKYSEEGLRTIVVTCTGGERGEVLNKYLAKEALANRIAEVRATEMEEAARILGLTRHYWLGFEDSGFGRGGQEIPRGTFASVPIDEPVRRLTEILRIERPQVVITYDEIGGYPHPDHIRTHEVSMKAIDAAADSEYAPELGPTHQVEKVYYHATFTQERLKKLHAILVSLGKESPFEQILETRSGFPEKEVTTRIDVVEYLPVRRKSLLAHRSQIDPDSFFLQIPDELLAESLPTDDYHLVRSTVKTGIPENDLFEGVR